MIFFTTSWTHSREKSKKLKPSKCCPNNLQLHILLLKKNPVSFNWISTSKILLFWLKTSKIRRRSFILECKPRPQHIIFGPVSSNLPSSSSLCFFLTISRILESFCSVSFSSSEIFFVFSSRSDKRDDVKVDNFCSERTSRCWKRQTKWGHEQERLNSYLDKIGRISTKILLLDRPKARPK